MKPAVPTPTVLVIADDLTLVESLRGAFGEACQVLFSSSIEAGLDRVKDEKERLCAVLINLSLPGLNAKAAVQSVHAAHGDVTLLGFKPASVNGHSHGLNGSHVHSVPVEWTDLRALAPAPKPATNGHAHPRSGLLCEMPLIELPSSTQALVESSSPEPEAEITSSFLRDEAMRLEHANFFEAHSSTEPTPVSGRILRVSPSFVVCEVLDPQRLLQGGWSTHDARVQLAHREAYRGPARLNKVVNTGSALICEWALQGNWHHVPPVSGTSAVADNAALTPFFERMKLLRRISDVFKAIVAEVASVLEEARQCLDRIEISLQPPPGQTRAETLHAVIPDLQRELFPAFDHVFAKFEEVSQAIPPDLDAEYHSLVRQRLHPLMMCAPFIHHVYAKPLGFAGDYAALHKLIGDPFEGQTLFAKLLNGWLVLTSAGDAYRHRLALLVEELRKQAAACHQRGQGMRVLSIGCGAANEVVRFFETEELSHRSEFTLVDFNEPTLAFAKQQVEKSRQENSRLARVEFVQSSVQRLVLDEARMRRKGLPSNGPVACAAGYDFIHCTGLFDYFSDRVCSRLLHAMLGMLAPGGRLIVCNFTPANPIRYFMKYVLDWNLVHRTPAQLRALMPMDCELATSESPRGTEAYVIATRTFD